jgi:hypothetical protein
VGQDHVFTQVCFDQPDDILNTGREAWRRLSQAIDGRHWQNQASRQTGDYDVVLQFSETRRSRRAERTQNEHSDDFHRNNPPHL